MAVTLDNNTDDVKSDVWQRKNAEEVFLQNAGSSKYFCVIIRDKYGFMTVNGTFHDKYKFIDDGAHISSRFNLKFLCNTQSL